MPFDNGHPLHTVGGFHSHHWSAKKEIDNLVGLCNTQVKGYYTTAVQLLREKNAPPCKCRLKSLSLRKFYGSLKVCEVCHALEAMVVR